MIESIEWKKTAEELPDEEILVLYVDLDGDVSTGVTMNGKWICTVWGDNASVIDSPEWWAHMPAGPVVLSEAI
jgi:hypothetical protein